MHAVLEKLTWQKEGKMVGVGGVNLLCIHRPNSLKIWGLMAMFVISKQR